MDSSPKEDGKELKEIQFLTGVWSVGVEEWAEVRPKWGWEVGGREVGGREEGVRPGNGEQSVKTKGDRDFRFSGNAGDVDSKLECSYRSQELRRWPIMLKLKRGRAWNFLISNLWVLRKNSFIWEGSSKSSSEQRGAEAK